MTTSQSRLLGVRPLHLMQLIVLAVAVIAVVLLTLRDLRLATIASVGALAVLIAASASIRYVAMLIVISMAAQVGASWRVAEGAITPSVLAAALLVLIYLIRAAIARSETAPANRISVVNSLVLLALVSTAVISTAYGAGSFGPSVPWIVAGAGALVLSLAVRQRFLSTSDVVVSLMLAVLTTGIVDYILLIRGEARNTGPFNSGRFSGALNDYELLAEFYAAGFLLALMVLLFARKKLEMFLALIVMAVAAPLILATQSRGPVLLLGIAFPIVCLIAVLRVRSSRLRVAWLLATIIAFLAPILPFFIQSDTFRRIVDIELVGTLSEIVNRGYVWPYFTSLASFRDAGWFGNGVDFPYLEIGTYPHSLYLWSVWSLGFVGTALLLTMAILAVVPAFWYRSAGWVGVAIASVLVFILVDQIKIELTREPTYLLLFFCLIGLLIGLNSSETRRPQEADRAANGASTALRRFPSPSYTSPLRFEDPQVLALHKPKSRGGRINVSR